MSAPTRRPSSPSTPRRRVAASLIGLTFGGLALAACGGSAAESGETIIEAKLAEQIGLGDLDATCNEPADMKEGETFTCTATTGDDRTVEFVGTMTSDDKFEIVTSNLLTADDVVTIREEGARVLSEQVGATIEPDDIACPDDIVLLDDTGDFVCQITDTSTGDDYDLTVSTGGIEPGVGVRKLYFQIADEPN